MKTKIIAVCLGVFCLFKANAQLTQVESLSTGVYNGTTTLIPANGILNDDTWQVDIGGGFGNVKVASLTGTWASNANANWISPMVTGSGTAKATAWQGPFAYKMTFFVPACVITKATIHLNAYAADNNALTLDVNTHSHSISATFTSLSHDSIIVPVAELTPGATNTIYIHTFNNLSGTGQLTYTGLFVDGDLTIKYAGDPTLVSHITGPSQICSGNALTFNGSTSTGTAAHHVWTVIESNASGIPVAGATEWWSPSIPGNAGSYTIPSAAAGGPTLVCGKYYRVKLALTGSCDAWKEDATVVHVNCVPVANAGLDKTICVDSCTTIGAGKTALGVTYTWTNAQGYQGTGKPFTACPATTTTYTLTATDNSTGCSATDAVTITLIPPTHALFGFSDDPTPLTYYTVTVTPTYPAEASQPGWGDTWEIQERDPANPATILSSTTSGSNPNPTCWWSYGAPHSFTGFDGTINVNCSGPAMGQFLYGHYYMIKRTTWNSACGPDVSYHPSYRATRSVGARPIHALSVGTGTTDYIDIAAGIAASDKETNLNVYPNPSTGIFTIEMNNPTKTNMEVYDMLGNKVKEAQITGSYELDLTGYSKGIYMIRMIVNDKPVMKKIIIE